MTQTSWSHLPNIEYIDKILISAKMYPREWNSSVRWIAKTPAFVTALNLIFNRVQYAIGDSAFQTALNAALDAATQLPMKNSERNMICTETRNVIYGAILCLSLDNCGYMIDSIPEHLLLLSKLGDENATLLYPISIAFNRINNKFSVSP